MRKPSKKLIAAQQKLLAAMDTMLREKGATEQDREQYRYVLQTPVGPLELHLAADQFGIDVYSCFDCPKAARAAVSDSNPYSGKWNHDYSNTFLMDRPDNAEYIIADVSRNLDKVLSFVPDQVCLDLVAREMTENIERNAAFKEMFAQWRAEGDARRAALEVQ